MAIWPHIRCAICRRTCLTRLYTTGAYPLAVTVPPWRSTDGEATVVFGELHWLASTNYGALLQQLDRYEGDEYMRFIRDVITVEGSAVRAWVYLGEAVHAAQFPLIAGGDWRKRAGHVGD
ncbi:MAG: gamma-glutamylcyclotransferase family protein [Caldilineaceae bacterium]